MSLFKIVEFDSVSGCYENKILCGAREIVAVVAKGNGFLMFQIALGALEFAKTQLLAKGALDTAEAVRKQLLQR